MFDLLEAHFQTMWWLSVVWVIVSFTGIYFWYRSRGRFFVDPPSGSAVYEERFASGCSRKSFLTSIGGARNCLRIWVTADRLYVRPFFPFLILGPLYDLVHSIPLERVDRLRTRDGVMSRAVDIPFTMPDGSVRVVTISSKRYQEFVDALSAAIEQKKSRPNQALQTTSVTRSGFGKVSVSDRPQRGV